MFFTSPACVIARKGFLSMVLHEPFQFSIPALGMVSNSDMQLVIETYWMPWLWSAWDWAMVTGIIPWHLVRRGPHMVPECPGFDQGEIRVVARDAYNKDYLWFPYEANGTCTMEADKKIRWFKTSNQPARDGVIRSPLVSLLPNYRSLVKLRNAQDIISTQAPRPVHLLERRATTPMTAPNDQLAGLSADFGAKAAGVAQARRHAMKEEEERRRQSDMFRLMNSQAQRNLARSSARPVLPTDTEELMYDEIDNGFGSRLIVLPADHTYKEAGRPTLPVDYQKAEDSFNILAAAVMDYSFEMVAPTRGASNRGQNVNAAARFENDRIHQQTSFFTALIRTALVLSYGKALQDKMDETRKIALQHTRVDPALLGHLYPELDVVVKLTSSNTTSDDDLRQFRADGLMTQETMGRYLFRNKNIPVEDMVTLQWPDNVPREMLVKPTSSSSKGESVKPPKKRAKITKE